MTRDALRADAVLPSLWIRFWHRCCVLAAAVVHAAARRLCAPRHATRRPPLLCVEGGPAGWEIIELIELAASASEYLGADHVRRVVVPSRDVYLDTVRAAIADGRVTHYLYDPRTGAQESPAALWEAFHVGLMTARAGVIPIGWLTDLPIRRWRLQVAIATAASGVTVTLMAAAQVARVFPHRRLSGPVMMPLSEATLATLEARREQAREVSAPRAVFTGSLYEPRTTALFAIRDGLRAQGLELEILSRELGGPRVPNEVYWHRLVDADIVVTTADQVFGDGIDDTGLPHLIYRYSEALAAGALLIAPAVPAIERYFVPGEHFVHFDDPAHAVEVIAHYLANPDERRRIAHLGYTRLQHLVRARGCWLAIDAALGTDALV
ncbi:MAG: glycosyltransferase [Gemmatimonadota bacterium]